MKHDPASIKAVLAIARPLALKEQLSRLVPFLDLVAYSPPNWLYTSGKPNRYNPAGIHCVYFAEARSVAQDEYDSIWQGLRGKDQPVTTYTAEVSLKRVLDLTRANVAIEGEIVTGLKPWREVVTPHKDVASGKHQQAEFAADLWQAHIGEGSDEYRHPVEFLRRTFLTNGLRDLLAGALLRLSGQGGDPVIELQTNFGGGKTHSMLALYHRFCGMKAAELPGLEQVFEKSGINKIPAAKRVVSRVAGSVPIRM